MKKQSLVWPALLVADIICVAVAVGAAYQLRIASALIPYHAFADIGVYLRTTLLAVPLWIAAFAVEGLYTDEIFSEGMQAYTSIFKACTVSVIGIMVVNYSQHDTLLSRGVLLLTWLLSILFVGGMRFVVRRILRRLRASGRLNTQVLIVGANEHGKAVAAQLMTNRKAGLRVAGFLDDHLPAGSRVMDDIDVVGMPSDLVRIAPGMGVTSAIIIPDALLWETWHDLLSEVASSRTGLKVHVSPGMYDLVVMGQTVTRRAGIPLLAFDGMRLTGEDAVLKSVLDYAATALLAIPAAVLSAVVAALILIAEGRPVFARTPAIGARGRRFFAYTFRTFSVEGVRTPLGEFLFHYGLDRLPKLINVLRGEMSLVGPRALAHIPAGSRADWVTGMLGVKPGITGPWVNRDDTGMREHELSLMYIRNWSFWTDLQILFKTVWRLVAQRPVRHATGTGLRLRQAPLS